MTLVVTHLGKVVLHLHPLVHLWKDDTFRQFLVKSRFVVITNDDRQTDSRRFVSFVYEYYWVEFIGDNVVNS